MGARGRKPKDKQQPIGVVYQKRPNPPSGMTPRARNLFKRIVGDNPTTRFDVEGVSILRAFCEADNQHYLATTELKSQPAVVNVETKAGNVPRRNPWFDIQKESAAILASLSTKLRAKGVSTEKPKASENPRKGLMFGG